MDPTSISAYATAISAFATTVLVIITALYVSVTYGLLKESRELRISAQRSYVTADIESEGSLLFFVVRNIGRTPARSIKVSTTPALPGRRGDLSEFTISGLGVGQERKYLVAPGPICFSQDYPQSYEMTIEWIDTSSIRLSYSHTVDMGSYKDSRIERNEADGLAKIADRLGEVVSALRKRSPKFRTLARRQTQAP